MTSRLFGSARRRSGETGHTSTAWADAVQIEMITPGSTSALVPTEITASPDVAGIELPRPGASPEYAGWYRVAPVGVQVGRIQINYSLPAGAWVSGPQGSKFAGNTYDITIHGYFEYAPCDGNGNPTGPAVEIPGCYHQLNQQRPFRNTIGVDVPPGEYVVRARNVAAALPTNQNGSNSIIWDFLGGWRQAQTLRPGIAEIAMRVRAGPRPRDHAIQPDRDRGRSCVALQPLEHVHAARKSQGS